MSLGLPAETLARIFVHCLPGSLYVVPRIKDAPLLLVQVCRHWREVAITTPRLWCHLNAIQDYGLDVPLPRMDGRDVMGYASWLSRSGSCPLSLAASFNADGHNRQQWLGFLLHHRKRLHRLRVVDEEELDLNAFLDGADALNALNIKGWGSAQVKLAITHPLVSLCTLVVENVSLRSDSLTSTGWAKLSHLAVRLPSSNEYQTGEFLSLISRCPNLRTLVFGGLTHCDPPTPVLPGSHSNLRSLSIILDPISDFEDVGAVLILPGLQSLRVKHGDYPPCLDEALVEEDLEAMDLPHRVCFLDIGCSEAFSLFDLSWGSITHLEVEVDGAVDVLNMALKLCGNLEHLVLIIQRGGERPTSLFSPVTHGSLSVLSIYTEGRLGNVFEHATFPTLQRLAIGAACCGEHDNIYTFLDRSRCPLRFLKIRTGRGTRTWTEQERLDLLRLMPTLTDLDLLPFCL